MDSPMSPSKSLCDKCGYSPLADPDAQIPEAVSTELFFFKHSLDASNAEKVRETMDLARCRIARLDEEISRIADVLHDLRRRRKDFDKFSASQAALIAPIRKIPMELLHNILLKYMAGDHERPKKNSKQNSKHYKRHLDQGPLILASVCRTWRNATLALPTIWSDIRIRIRIRMRAKYVKTDEMSDSEVEKIHQPILDLIISTSNRWKELYIRDVAPSLRSKILDSSLDYQIPRSLEFTGSTSPYPFDISQSAPLLRTLTIHRPSGERLGIPWAQLRYLAFRGTEGQHSSNSQTILDILALTTNLHTLTMPYYVQGLSTYHKCAISLPKLSQLAFRVSQGLVIGPPQNIFTALDLPAVQEVSFELLASATGVAWRTSPGLLALLSRSPVSCLIITALGKSTSSPSDENLVEILQALPGLKGLHSLGIGIRCTTKSLFDRLSYNPDIPMLVPLLKYISFRTKRLEHDVDIVSFVDAMESRAKHQPNVLRKIKIECLGRTPDADEVILLSPMSVARLKELGSGGEIDIALVS